MKKSRKLKLSKLRVASFKTAPEQARGGFYCFTCPTIDPMNICINQIRSNDPPC